MNRQIGTELLKQHTLRLFRVGVVAAPLIAALITAVAFGAAGRQGNDPLGADHILLAIGAPASVITMLALLLGVVGMTGEYRHQTITTTFLSTPRRRDVIVAKLAAHSITGLVMGVLAVVGSIVVAVPWLQLSDIALSIDSQVLRLAAGVVGSAALYGALGVSAGALLRNQTGAIAVVLVWLLAAEGAIGNLARNAAFVKWLPGAAGHDIVHSGSQGGGLPAGIAVAVFAAYVAILAVAATRVTLRRDVT